LFALDRGQPQISRTPDENSSAFGMLSHSRIFDVGGIVFMRAFVALSTPLRAANVKTDQILANSRKLKEAGDAGTSDQTSSGFAFPVADLIQTFKPEVWEDFTEEWAVSQEEKYKTVMRFTGANDMGLDILGFWTDKLFGGEWDVIQCKRYAVKLQPAQAYLEIGKIIYYSSIGEYPPPTNYYFAASKGIGLTLTKLLAKPDELKAKVIANWDTACRKKITDKHEVLLEGDLLKHLNKFDFSIFKMISVAVMIKDHAKTVFYQRRFGQAYFPPRPPVDPPPGDVQPTESRYVEQLFEVYSEKLKKQLNEPGQLAAHPEIEKHFNRSRELFYHAESLRNFPRDSVDPGAFEEIRKEIYHGVVDIYDMEYKNGYARLSATLAQAAQLSPNCNTLCIRVQTQDKQGLCHHLANENSLIWVKKDA
jgi:hypothetical protein